MAVAKLSTRAVGNAGEDKACAWLRSHGYEIVARNWRARCGEIDIIAHKDGVLVFAEVKTLPSGDAETLAHELGRRKQRRIVETAQLFLANHRKYRYTAVRFDVLVVDMPNWSEVYHIEDAFSEPV